MTTKAKNARELSLFFFVAMLVAFACGAIVLNQNKGVIYEFGDYAVTSLLVQDAKHQFITQGHYSRLGFNHPGPAILYAFTAGEVVFYDWLHIADSPLVGQLLGITCYAALWLAMCCVLFSRITCSRAAGLFLLSAFAFASAWMQPPELLGLWFPYPVYLPFATFALALSRLCIGKGDSLIALAISCGFLWHGHVSFAPITGLMVVCALLCNLVVVDGAFHFEPRRLLRFAAAEKARLFGVALILFIFLVPLIIRTIRDFPDPIRQYLSFGASNNHHGIFESIQFVAQYWGGGGWIAIALVTASTSVIVLAAKRSAELHDLVGIICVGAAGSLALLLYAIFGVDSLDFRYIGLFYEAIPAIFFACAVYVLLKIVFRYLPIWMAGTSWAFISIGLSIAAGYLATKSLHYTNRAYNDQSIPALYARIHDLGQHGVALDLTQGDHWIFLWTHLAGAEVYAKRHGERLFCIEKNWHILFTREAKCSEEDLAALPKFQATATALADEAGNTDPHHLYIAFERVSQP